LPPAQLAVRRTDGLAAEWRSDEISGTDGDGAARQMARDRCRSPSCGCCIGSGRGVCRTTTEHEGADSPPTMPGKAESSGLATTMRMAARPSNHLQRSAAAPFVSRAFTSICERETPSRCRTTLLTQPRTRPRRTTTLSQRDEWLDVRSVDCRCQGGRALAVFARARDAFRAVRRAPRANPFWMRRSSLAMP
jgi:hypothetical protein